MEIGKVRLSNETISEQDNISERFSNNTRDRQTNSIIKLFNIQNRKIKTCIEIIKGVVTNPLIFMTVLGVFCGTFVFDGKGNNNFLLLVIHFLFKLYYIEKNVNFISLYWA